METVKKFIDQLKSYVYFKQNPIPYKLTDGFFDAIYLENLRQISKDMFYYTLPEHKDIKVGELHQTLFEKSIELYKAVQRYQSPLLTPIEKVEIRIAMMYLMEEIKLLSSQKKELIVNIHEKLKSQA